MKYLAAIAFVSTVVAANWALTKWGTVPVGFGLEAPAGVYFAGLGFLLRDLLHETGGRLWVIGAIVIGACASWYVGADLTLPGGLVPIYVASGCAFLVSEFADFAAYAPLRERTLTGAVALSQIVGAAVDSALFLWLVGLATWPLFWGQFVGKTLLTIPVVLALLAWRYRSRTAYA